MDNNFFLKHNKFLVYAIALLICVFFILGHFIIGGILLLLYIIFVLYNIRVCNIKESNAKKDEWKKVIEEFSSKLDISLRNVLVNSPFALIIVGSKGDILWYNQLFLNIFDKKEFLGKKVQEIIKEINMDEIINKKKKLFKHINIKDRYYNVFTNINSKPSSRDNAIILYFYEVTCEVELARKIQENRYSIMHVEVDNLSDVLKTTEEDKAVILSAEIERTLINYAQALKGMIIKYSSSKYAIVTHYKNIEEEMKRNFDILDEIREINYGNKLTVTLSIGVGCDGDTPLQNHEFAMSAKELALSRGGDQVVVKTKNKLEFFGGKTKEFEKRTKVRARVIAHALVNLINESSNIFIMGHINPDIDALGSAIGIRSVVKALGKDVFVVLDKVNSGIENSIERIKENNLYDDIFISRENCLRICDYNSLLILVDVNSREYVQDKELLEVIERKVIIDHHRKSTTAVENTLLSYIEPYASSTCELVTEMVQYMIENPKQHITSLEAEMLLAGIYVDTKNFYFKTGVRTFEAAAYLRHLGADIIEVKKMFADHLETYLKKAELISLAEVKNDIAIVICPPDIKDNVLAAQVADELLNITGVQASFVLVKIGNEVFISGRSFGDINVQVILETLGGGGHMTIAGTKMNNVSMDEAKEKLQNAIDKYLREGEE
ncbi:DHH family phosphoesterase [Clostridium thermopalmarium]|uniref:Cyclic-di-AMP phosphodiesterase n=1 Tax=Clostridium thermopalmarium DSM 5974 TaxID=1121340 RepID=A0A2T0APZ2_9CLOT|nr:DHH family phosphoesterase [Clostridium thermopalmarium]PRR71122.1 Bifunctional oligoribonuclease and PAP phosphatase NrnA [Clostridium thermopalmarium DSM 5974]PVZ20990.1 c-di-AMP phosphodiesterase-like protein [Clostridium thermopalmarium DSM 5974]